MSSIRVVLVDDHDLIREGLRRAFERTEDVQVVGEAGNAADALELARALRPDAVTVDLRLPDGDGLALTAALRAELPAAGIVVVTMYAGDEQLFAALDAGASAFLPKDAPAEEVVLAVRHAVAAPSHFAAANLAAALRRREHCATVTLSAREQGVLEMLGDGLSVPEISRRLYLSESTVKTHVSHLYDKLGAANRAQALMAAVQLGLLANSTAH